MQQIGWRALFYIQGCIALVWSALWFVLIDEFPSNHPRISEREKNTILGSIGQQHAGRRLQIPWCSILRSVFRLFYVLGFIIDSMVLFFNIVNMRAYGLQWHLCYHCIKHLRFNFNNC